MTHPRMRPTEIRPRLEHSDKVLVYREPEPRDLLELLAHWVSACIRAGSVAMIRFVACGRFDPHAMLVYSQDSLRAHRKATLRRARICREDGDDFRCRAYAALAAGIHQRLIEERT